MGDTRTCKRITSHPKYLALAAKRTDELRQRGIQRYKNIMKGDEKSDGFKKLVRKFSQDISQNHEYTLGSLKTDYPKRYNAAVEKLKNILNKKRKRTQSA